MSVLLALVLGLAFGSIPTGVILGFLFGGADIRRLGSGNIGAANVARSLGFKVGVLVAVIDILKGAVPVLIAQRAGLGHGWLALVALAAVLGHDFSPWLRGRGGKGVATTLGVALVLTPVPALLALGAWVGVMLAWRYSSLASLAALAFLPFAATFVRAPAAYILLAAGLFLLAAAKHWENILRLLAGREPKFRPKSSGG